MKDDTTRYEEFRSLNHAAPSTWLTVSFEDWKRYLKTDGNQTYWGDFAARRDRALERVK